MIIGIDRLDLVSFITIYNLALRMWVCSDHSKPGNEEDDLYRRYEPPCGQYGQSETVGRSWHSQIRWSFCGATEWTLLLPCMAVHALTGQKEDRTSHSVMKVYPSL